MSDRVKWYDGAPAAGAALVKRCERQLSIGRYLDGACVRLYYAEEGHLPAGTTANQSGDIGRASRYLRAFDGLRQENVIKSAIDAAASMIIRKPACKVITSGGSWKKQIAARKASRLLTGMYSTSGLESATPSVWKDSARCMLGGSKWLVDDGGAVTAERCLPHTLVWNPQAGPTPRELYQHHGLPLASLQDRYPDFAQRLERLPSYRPDPAFFIDARPGGGDSEQVDVYELWRLPAAGSPGRYVMLAGDMVLEDEPWTLPVFPIVTLAYGDGYDSLGGAPLARDLLPFQLKLNRMNRAIDENAAKCAIPRIAMPRGAEVAGTPQRVQEMAEIMYYNAAGGSPAWIPGQLLPPQYYAEKAATKAAAFEQAGVSQSVASATKSPGLNSGRAQREEYDRASGRLVLDAERLERWFEQNFRVALGMMRQAYGSKSKRLRAPNTRLLEEIDWSEVGDLKEDEIEVRCYITSSIPNSPAGRAETLAERVEAGVMTAQRAARWQADPDTARMEDWDSAPEDLAMRIIDSAIVDGEPMQPDPIMGQEGLTLLVDLAGRELMRSLTLPDPPPERNQELLRRVIAEAQLLLKPPAPPMPAPGAALPPPGPGAPADLLAPDTLGGAPPVAPPGADPAMADGLPPS